LNLQSQITAVDFSADRIEQYELNNDSLREFLAKPREDWVTCRWINVNGLSWDVVRLLGSERKLHSLALEDLMHTRNRTKADWYPEHVFGKSVSHLNASTTREVRRASGGWAITYLRLLTSRLQFC